ncbi:uncharacterized protein LOC133835594 [Drosophila sulfurigaster albostrigata]|uniref:uncharacterized protein LOC132786934 n=1 Tax=Drosophila nasuta TaxID=42062 RepID=UPI00295E464D|nr:uncharacterized protein LOC132786934 [Drosophila nasuta]XP_062121587.1 uncharacterized protein LOC133835594 [Drosophila sulfurigaster albostrigata]
MQSYGGPDQSHLHKSEQRAVFAHPATHPWLLDGMPWMLATTNAPQPGGVMQFGANTNHNAVDIETQCGKWQQKRKSLEQQASGLPPKQLITEERITAHFSGLQISGDANGGVVSGPHNNNSSGQNVNGGLATDDIPSTSTGKTHHPNPAYQMAAMELEQKLRNANRIVICDEVKQGVVSPVVAAVTGAGAMPPEWLIKSIPRPCTALVPWQPPTTLHIPLHNKEQATRSSRGAQHASSNVARNAAAVVDLDDYDDELQFFENNNTCNVNLNKSDEQMDEDL